MYVCMCVTTWDTSLCCVCVCTYVWVFICLHMYKGYVCFYLGQQPLVCMCSYVCIRCMCVSTGDTSLLCGCVCMYICVCVHAYLYGVCVCVCTWDTSLWFSLSQVSLMAALRSKRAASISSFSWRISSFLSASSRSCSAFSRRSHACRPITTPDRLTSLS